MPIELHQTSPSRDADGVVRGLNHIRIRIAEGDR
jgi:hypothetical protein